MKKKIGQNRTPSLIDQATMTNDPGGHRPINQQTAEKLRHVEQCPLCSKLLVLKEVVMKDSQGNIVKAFRLGQ